MPDSELFSGLDDDDVAALAEALAMEERAYAKDEALLRRGDVGVPAGLVVEGRVRMEATDGLGATTVLGWADAGDLFAEAYAVLGDEPLLVDVVAALPSRVLWVDVARLEVAGDPACLQVRRNLGRIVARRNVRLSQRAFHTAPKTLRAKLMAYLATMEAAAGVGRGCGFDIPLTRQQLAGYLGADRSALSRELGRMANDGLIEVRGRHVRLREP